MLAFLTIWCALCPCFAAVPSAIVIKNARVITGAGPEFAQTTVLLRRGLIEAVDVHFTIPANAWVIDRARLTVYPGFIDGLSTWGLAAAVPTTPARSPGSSPALARPPLKRKPTCAESARIWVPMHIPDNFLSPPVWLSLDAVALPAVAWVARQAQRSTDENRLPLLGVMGAFVFAAQMINFPVGIGTSGHLVGGTLLALLLGPWSAALVLTGILTIQALLFQDGGVLALGANVVNMALAGVLAGYLPARLLSKTKWASAGVVAGGFCSVFVSGLLALSELLCSHVRIPPALALISLLLFAANAVLEGLITLSVLRAIERLRPGSMAWAPQQSSAPASWRRASAALLACAVALACGVVLLASTRPDGLEHLGAALRIRGASASLFGLSPLRDYQVRVLGGNWFSRASAGLVGLLAVYLLCALGSFFLGRTRRSFSS